MIIFLSVIELLILLSFIIISIASMIKGAVYLPSSNGKVKQMLDMVHIKPGMKTADLGSGDGRIIIAMAEKGAVAHGYEINPFLVLWSQYRIRKRKLQKNAVIHWGNFWSENYSSFDVVVIYGIFYIMEEVGKKLSKELKPGSLIVSNGFPIPGWKYIKKENALYVYKI
jgi:ribosomal protein L11 methylase PrmA